MKKTASLRIVTLIAAGALMAGCATQQQNRTAIGAGTGAAVGAGLGALFGNSTTAAIGAGIGAAVGGVTGYNWGKIKGDVENSGASNMGIDVAEQPDGSLKVNVPSTVSFDTDSYTLKPALRPVLDTVARSLAENPQLRAHVVGHTDSTGQASYNQTLSENRARAVTNYLARAGVSASRLTSEGRAATDPIADNATVEGRAQNRRVEIYMYAPQK